MERAVNTPLRPHGRAKYLSVGFAPVHLGIIGIESAPCWPGSESRLDAWRWSMSVELAVQVKPPDDHPHAGQTSPVDATVFPSTARAPTPLSVWTGPAPRHPFDHGGARGGRQPMMSCSTNRSSSQTARTADTDT